jgi:phosphoglycolate phosphatase-like HAD superfamily hydrolase
MRPKAIIFDLDGTLIHFPHEYLFDETERICQLLDEDPVDRKHMQECFRDFDFFRMLPELKRDDLTQKYWQHFDHGRYPKPRPFDFTKSLLRDISSSGIRIAVATARTRDFGEVAKSLADYTDFSEYLCYVASREKNAKSDWRDKSAQITSILKHFNMSASEVMMVGDIPPDVHSAKEMKLGWSVAVLSGGIHRHVLEAAQPDYLLSHADELRDVLGL